MKTKRDLHLHHAGRLSYDIPAGAGVIHTPPGGSGLPSFAIANPAKYGANSHDSTYYYMYVPEEEVDFEGEDHKRVRTKPENE